MSTLSEAAPETVRCVWQAVLDCWSSLEVADRGEARDLESGV